RSSGCSARSPCTIWRSPPTCTLSDSPFTAQPYRQPWRTNLEIDIGRGKKGRRAYGFDDIAIVPSRRTRDPDDIDITWTLGPYRSETRLPASAMDGVVSPDTAVLTNQLGGLGVLNLEGIWTRFEDAEEKLEAIAAAPKHEATRIMQEIYAEPVKEELIS